MFFVCNATSLDAAVELLRQNLTNGATSNETCMAECGGGWCTPATVGETPSEVTADLVTTYRSYLDMICSEALRSVSSIDTSTPTGVTVRLW